MIVVGFETGSALEASETRELLLVAAAEGVRPAWWWKRVSPGSSRISSEQEMETMGDGSTRQVQHARARSTKDRQSRDGYELEEDFHDDG